MTNCLVFLVSQVVFFNLPSCSSHVEFSSLMFSDGTSSESESSACSSVCSSAWTGRRPSRRPSPSCRPSTPKLKTVLLKDLLSSFGREKKLGYCREKFLNFLNFSFNSNCNSSLSSSWSYSDHSVFACGCIWSAAAQTLPAVSLQVFVCLSVTLTVHLF